MKQITVQVEGMQCGMCESHINDVVRRHFQVKKVTSSHRKGTTIIVTKEEIDKQKLRTVIEETGYQVLAVSEEPYEKKGLFMSK